MEVENVVEWSGEEDDCAATSSEYGAGGSCVSKHLTVTGSIVSSTATENAGYQNNHQDDELAQPNPGVNNSSV